MLAYWLGHWGGSPRRVLSIPSRQNLWAVDVLTPSEFTKIKAGKRDEKKDKKKKNVLDAKRKKEKPKAKEKRNRFQW